MLHDRLIARGSTAVLGTLVLVLGLPGPASAYSRPGSTERVSVASGNVVTKESASHSPAMSANGRFVTFSSFVQDLVPGDAYLPGGPDADPQPDWDVFVHDRATATTERVSVASDGEEGDGDSQYPDISADGRYVAFMSEASNFAPDDTNGTFDAFVHDRLTARTERVSVASDGTGGNNGSTHPRISADGRYVVFTSGATNLVADDTNAAYDVFVHDRTEGTTERVSLAPNGDEIEASSTDGSISSDGGQIGFTVSSGSKLEPDDEDAPPGVYVHDLATRGIELVSVTSDGSPANDFSVGSALNGDGRFIAFISYASNLVPADANGGSDIFVRDRLRGTTERVSVTSSGAEATGVWLSTIRAGGAWLLTISDNGRYVGFRSDASNQVSGDTNEAEDIFVHDRQTGTTERISVAVDGSEANGSSTDLAMSADGRFVAFSSFATNLVEFPGPGVDRLDVYVRDRGPAVGTGELVAKKTSGELHVSGWATFSGTEMTSAEDASDDGEGSLGAEIIEASVSYRPEPEDLLLRMKLASMPEPVVGGAPGVLYGWRFSVGGNVFAVQAVRVGGTAVPPAVSHFGLYRCAPLCLEVTRLSGGIGTTGREVRVSLPLASLEAQEGSALTAIAASTALGEASTGSIMSLDEVVLANVVIPVTQVSLGVAPVSVPMDRVVFTQALPTSDGRFSETIAAGSLADGDYHVWARVCVGNTCEVNSVRTRL